MFISKTKTLFLVLLGMTIPALSQLNDPVVMKRFEEIKKMFYALPEETRKDYLEKKAQAFRKYDQAKYFSALALVLDCKTSFQLDTDLRFIEGLCYANIQDVDNAMDAYEAVLRLSPYHYNCMMNVVELYFFDGQYENALKYIDRIHRFQKSEDFANDSLLDFKQLIILKKLEVLYPGKYKKQIQELKDSYTYLDDTPFYYYAKALEVLETDKSAGLAWLVSSYNVFQKSTVIELWNKALIDTGYLEEYDMVFNRTSNRK